MSASIASWDGLDGQMTRWVAGTVFVAVVLLVAWLAQPGPSTLVPADRSLVVFWHFWGGQDRQVIDDVVRRFNRVVTQRVGALDEEYLARGRPLGASRLLWEIGLDGTGGAEVRALRQQLDLDSGYLSRLLRRLESEGLVYRRLFAATR